MRTVAEHGNISAAAHQLGITQPALTGIVSRVEDQMGARLFDRRPRGVTVTCFWRGTDLVVPRQISSQLDLRPRLGASSTSTPR
jgi:hypothetical protein